VTVKLLSKLNLISAGGWLSEMDAGDMCAYEAA